jgi:hypothetical protein
MTARLIRTPSGRIMKAGDLKPGQEVKFDPRTGKQVPPAKPKRKRKVNP